MTKTKKETDDNDGGIGQSGKEANSRCSPTKFISLVEQLVPKLGDPQLKRIEASPLAPWLKIPKLCISPSRVDAMLKRFEVETCSFCFGSNIMVPFTSMEFSIVIGLPSVGQPINIDLKLGSNFVERHFKGMKCVKRNAIIEKLFDLADSEVEVDVDDFFRFFILLLFNCVIFPISNFGTPRFIFPYLDNLENFFEYAWGDAAFRFLRAEIEDHLGYSRIDKKQKTYMGGCLVGLMAWVYERVPILGRPRVLHCFPRLFKWGDSKIPVNLKGAESALMAISSNKIVPIKPFEEEKLLVGDMERFGEVKFRSNDSELREHIKKLEMEIEMLKKKHEVVEEDANRSDMHDEVPTDYGVDVDYDGGVPVDEVPMSTEKEGKSESFDRVVVDEVQFNTNDKGNAEVFDRVVVDESEMNTSAGDSDHGGSDTGKGKEMVIYNPRSSIVKNVQRRKDRLKKRKDPDYMTPPSTTPKRKRKQRLPEVMEVDDMSIDVSGIAAAAVEECFEKFRGRQDFIGHDKISKEDRNIIEKFICGDTLCGVVWQDDDVVLYGQELLPCLFGKELRSDLIHAYFNLLSNKAPKYGHEIYCMSPNVPINVIGVLDKSKPKLAKEKHFSELLSQLSKSTLSKLSTLKKEVLQRCKYLLFPISYKAHWVLLVYTPSTKCFTLKDSLRGPVYKGVAKKFAQFLSRYLWKYEDCDFGKGEVISMKSGQQGDDLNCGVYVCLWGECFAQDTEKFWEKEWDETIKWYRANIVSAILSDERGLFKGE